MENLKLTLKKMLLIRFFAIFAVTMICITVISVKKCYAQETVIQAWATTFGNQDSIMPSPMVKDYSGHVYIAGYTMDSVTGANIVTVKYDSLGAVIWSATYTGTGYHRDQATAIAVDTFGNVYVAGFTYTDSINNYDFITIRYDSLGNQKWVVTHDGGYSMNDAASAIVVKDGFEWVTGATFDGFGLFYDYTTIQYD